MQQQLPRPRPRLLVVDDEPAIAEFVRDVAVEVGFEAHCASSSEEFLRRFDGEQDIVVLDLAMPGADGIELLREIAQTGCRPAIVLMSGSTPKVLQTVERLAWEHGFDVLGTLPKPFTYDALEELLLCQRHSQGEGGHPEDQQDRLEAAALEEALATRGIVVHYQPKVDFRNRVVSGVEALARWDHPERGQLSPATFIPLAIEAGLVDELTMAVLSRVAEDRQAWPDGGHILPVAINLDTSSLNDLALPDRIESLLREAHSPFDPRAWTFEVTETGGLDRLVLSLDVLARLRVKGFALSIDDFGTGYSTMKQLQEIPCEELKIDRSFVERVDKDPETVKVVRAMVELGHELNLNVVAEGVERLTQLNTLRDLHCDEAQGYLISRPVPSQELAAFLRSPAQLSAALVQAV